MDKRGGVSRLLVENFLSRSAENFRKGNPLVFIKFGYRKSLKIRGGEYLDLPSKLFFVSQCRKFP